MPLSAILERAMTGTLTLQEGYFLLTQTDPLAREAIRQAADTLRYDLVGDTVTYVVNRNINFTNICNQHCSFCAFRRDEDEAGAYWLDFAQILAKAQEAIHASATEICMQGGLNPKAKINGQSLNYYLKLVDTLKSAFPAIHLHAFSPQEVFFIAQEDNRSIRDVLIALKDHGVGSLPGTAAEVLYEPVRQRLCPEKLTSQQWIEVVKNALDLGLPMTCTLLSGHLENPEQRIIHLGILRAIQQQAKVQGFTEFILLPYVGEQAPTALRHWVGRDQPELADALLTMAVARLFLGRWIPNHQPSWVKLQLSGAQTALDWGCNDLGGTLMEEHITSMAGAKGGTCLSVSELRSAIEAAGRTPRQRTTVYGLIAEETVLALT